MVVHAILHPMRPNVFWKLKNLTAHYKAHNTKISGHVRTALTVDELVQQLKDAQFTPNDWIIEYSTVIYLERGLFGAPMWIRLRCGFGLGLLVSRLEWIYG
jgi:hypothetical protein